VNASALLLLLRQRASDTPDGVGVYLQLFASDGLTPLTDRVLVTSAPPVVETDHEVVFSILGSPVKADWDGARAVVEWDVTERDVPLTVRVTNVAIRGVTAAP
jgi:hypothetical protein